MGVTSTGDIIDRSSVTFRSPGTVPSGPIQRFRFIFGLLKRETKFRSFIISSKPNPTTFKHALRCLRDPILPMGPHREKMSPANVASSLRPVSRGVIEVAHHCNHYTVNPFQQGCHFPGAKTHTLCRVKIATHSVVILTN